MDDTQETLISRPYQVQLEEVAVKKNTIIHLPTGSGKTFIAVHLIARFRDALLKPWGQGGQRTFFLVNNVPLVNQQKKVIEQLCPVKAVGAYSSENRVDYWNKTKWDLELAKYQVIVMTSQILQDMLTHGYIRVQDINLMIFDECHHAVDDHPMRSIMKHFENCPVQAQPRIVGLTATLLNGNVTVNKVEETLKDLETTFHATIATVNELGEVLHFSTNPHEDIIFYKVQKPNAAAIEALKILNGLHNRVQNVKLPTPKSHGFTVKLQQRQHDITTDSKKVVKSVANIVTSMMKLIEELGIYGGTLGIIAYHILLERLKRKSSTKEESFLYAFTITASSKARSILLHGMETDIGYDKIIKNSSQKIIKFLEVLKEYNPAFADNQGEMTVNKSRKPLSAIIFTQERFTAKVLYNLLKDVKETNPKEFGFIKHDFIVGFNLNPFKSTREQYYVKKCSEAALLKFGNHELNCLISTSVIEEGVDIPQCLLVLRYDPPLEYRSYIQSKGRARSSESSYVLLVDEAQKDKFIKKHQSFGYIEKYIQRMLVGCDDRKAPSERDIQRDLYEEDDLPPFITPYGNRLSAVSAISLLNRYCSMLPHDQFTTIIPMWIEEKVTVIENGLPVLKSLITIMLPIASPVKQEIKGVPHHNIKIAKRAAALEACIKLYVEGELDPVTVLPKLYGAVDFDVEDVKKCFPNWPWGEKEDEDPDLPKAGTKKRIRKHEKEFPKYLDGPKDWQHGKQTFKLHLIKMTTMFKEPTEPRERALYDLLQSKVGFGFLTFRPLPKLCDFPMFLTVGEVTTSIQMNYATINLDKKTFELVKQFHYFLFDQVLEVAKKFLIHDGTVNTMYIVPVKPDSDAGFDIDWTTVQAHKEIRPVVEMPFEERKSLEVTQEKYRYSVVSPWYRASIEPGRYIVSNVLEYMSPKSSFDTEVYNSYEEYYSKRYNLEIVGDNNQPLLEVRNISSRMNCLLPRAATISELTDKQQKQISAALGDDKPKGFAEIFIPEFCIKYDFPGVLWYKAMVLPSIIHRIYMLLVAYELRAEIARGTQYGQVHLAKGESWKPIENIYQVAITALRSQVEEPPAINTIDRINNPLDDSVPRPVNIVSMKESVYQLLKKKLSMDYPWEEKTEPIDIDRNISTVTMMDIECYDEFVMAPIQEKSDFKVLSPARPATVGAICPPPLQYNEDIVMLSRTATGRGPELKDVLAALTTIESHDTFNLERAETLGDSFLKYSASLYLFHKFPKLTEGQLTNIKGRLIGNRNLLYAGLKARLGGRMKVEQFSPRKDFLLPAFFAPKEIRDFIREHKIRPTFLIGMSAEGGATRDAALRRLRSGDGAAEPEPPHHVQNAMQCYVGIQALSDKSVADCVEALVGTYLLSGGVSAAVKVLEWFQVFPAEDNLEALLKKRIPTAISHKLATEKDVEYILNNYRADVEEILDYKFNDVSFLLEALSHPSYIRNRLTRSYERLEFIGDAILDFLITAHIFENCRELKPGELTDLRSALVNNVTFASYVVKLGLHKYICSQLNPSLDKAIMAFAEHQEQRDHEIVEDVLYLIDEGECQIAEYVEVPKVLSDVLEALIGAVYLDSGGQLAAAWRVVHRIMRREIAAFSAHVPLQPVRMLYEKIHACPTFGKPVVIDKDIQRVMMPVTFTKNGRKHTVHGFGGNKTQAKRAAAKLALKVLSI